MGDYNYTTIWERVSLDDEDWGWYAPTKRDLEIYREGFIKRLPDCLEWTGYELLVACDGHRNLSPEDEKTLSKFSVEKALEGAYEDVQAFWDAHANGEPANIHNGQIVAGFTEPIWGWHFTWNEGEQVWEFDGNPEIYRTEVPDDAILDHMSYPVVKNEWGRLIDYEDAVTLMDTDIKEQLHEEMAPCTNQAFFDAYCEKHLKKYGEEFEPNKENPVW